MDKETYKQMERELIKLAESHNAEYDNSLTDFDEYDYPCFTIFKHNVPIVADMRMLAEKYNVTDVLVSEGSWGFVALDYSMREFKDENEYNEFVKIAQGV